MTEIISKIRKLLSLGKSANEHEAAAAVAKAQELLSRYNLSMEAIGPDEDYSAAHVRKKTRQRLEDWAFVLAAATAQAFDCSYYHSSRGETVFVGVGADPEVCGWMYLYLYKTLLRLASAHMRGPCKRLRSSKSKRLARESFLRGAAWVIMDRLLEQKKATPITPDALVISKQALIDAAMPITKTGRVKSLKDVRHSDFYAGQQTGNSVPLSTPINDTSAPLLALE